ncbi:hypothetical protein K4F52_001335 [Lecanicillium sp. MT-2017a]|nr:hypothetical protein K4F52_001335 [Lecanicillium sp. MT-2017a]
MAHYKTLRSLVVFAAFTTAVTCSYNNRQQQPLMTSPSPSNLEVHIEPGTTESTLQVKISNTHKDTPLTILTWDAPFDNVTRDSGSYHVQPASPPDADELKSPGVKVKRKMPAPRDDLLEIAPQGHVTRELPLKSRWLPSDGERYKVWAKGPWRAIWAKTMAEVTDEDLTSTRGDFGIGHTYETNQIEIVLR